MQIHEYLVLGLVIMLLVGAFSFWVMVFVYEVYFQLRGRAQTNREGINALHGSNVLFLHVPSQIAHAAGQGLGIRPPVLDGEFQDLDSITPGEVRELPEVHSGSLISSVDEEEINDLSVHEHTVAISRSGSSSAQDDSYSLAAAQGTMTVEVNQEALKEELICNKCLVPLPSGEAFLTFPCLHKAHLGCIYDGLRKDAVCPTCKFPVDLESRLG